MNTNSGLIETWINGPQGICLSEFTSKDGVNLKLNRITIGTTYKESGHVCGLPSNQTNDDIITKIKALADYENHVFLNDPTISEMPNRLQLYYLIASLESKKFDANGKLSSLDVIIFFEEFDPANCFKLLRTSLEKLYWKSHAFFWIP